MTSAASRTTRTSSTEQTGSQPPGQLTLPGQSGTAEGPHDLSGMYLMHHAFRRDLDRFVSAVRATPVVERQTWQALRARWEQFALVLHHHHTVEDKAIWPVMLESATREGREDDRRTLLDMEAEHETVDPALARCTTAYAEMAAHPCEDHRNALEVRVTTVRELLAAHLQHEETGALPLVQRTMTGQQWADSEKAAGKGYPTRMLPFIIAWVDDGLPSQARRALLATAGPVPALVLRLVRPWYVRRERRIFRHA